MFNLCAQCGLYRPDKHIDPSGPYAICPECGHRHHFLHWPLLIVGGANGTGKSTLCQYLTGRVAQAVLLDVDILWRPEFDTPENNYRSFFETWLKLAKNIGQSGRPVVLFGAGAGVPFNIEPCVERRYFSAVHYLALVCDDDTLVARLQARPAWRGSSVPDAIAAQRQFNRWFQTYDQQPPITRLDTSHDAVETTAAHVTAWIERCLDDVA